ncbi:hypothetical protein KUTeg_013455 [Tegillarca granosa]|uniref:HECT-type E3 ubiquitin transferase n=1 Tax=Tegillarca granosa TaxID=220873 RepID=A0ABQ9EW61_TEGGR|nr:hypothetical protein KUTeg_013455 [Tegillarca granosa]
MLEASYEKCMLEASYGKCMLEASYEKCMLEASYGKCMLEASYGKCMLEASYEKCMLEASYGKCMLEASYGKMHHMEKCMLEASYEKCMLEASYGKCMLEASYEKCMLEASYGKCMLEASYGKMYVRGIIWKNGIIWKKFLQDTILNFMLRASFGKLLFSASYEKCMFRASCGKCMFRASHRKILTILIGGLLIGFIMVMECMYGLRNAITRQGRLVSPAMTGGTGSIRPSLLPNPEKSWLWKLFWGVSVFPQHCVVKWEWTEPQLVGNTMSFTVQLFRKNGKPFAALDANSIFVEIFHKGTKVAYTKQLEKNDPDSNTIKVSFTVHKAGEYRITIMVSGRHIKDSPFIKRFEAGPIDAGRTGFTNYCSTIVCTAGIPYPLTIETQDTFGNPAVYKADQNNYFKIKVVQTENSIKYVPATQMIYNPEQKQLTMHIRMEKEGCYQATVSYGDVKLRNGDFNLLVISVDDMSQVNKNLARKSHNIWYEARLLSGDPDSNDKAKRVYVYISPKFYFNGYNSKYDSPVMTIHDGSQPPVILAAKERSGSETFQDKQLFFSQEVRRFHKKGTLTLKIDRLNLLYSSYRATKHFDASDWYKSFQIVFIGEQGLDWGGLRREWFEQVHPNPKRSHEMKLKMYEFAGKIVGKCLYDSALGSAYRQLYFEADDPELYKTKVRYIDENPIDDMELTFSEEEYSPEGQLLKVVDLIPGGSKLPVTNENKQHYLNCLAQYKLVSCVKEEVDHFLKGLNLLIPDNLLSIFDENELELLMCGTGNYSITDFKAHAVLDWFWTIVASFTEEQMARLLQFTTGCSQLPAGGFRELNPNFNQLCLPDYDTIDNFHKSLLIAINEGSQGFGLV